MKKVRIGRGIATVLCAATLVGCGASNSPNSKPITTPTTEQNQETQETDSVSMNDLLDEAILNGSVTQFSDGIFKVLPEIEKDGGQVVMQAASGYEDTMEQITVRYDENCQFQIAQMDAATGIVQLTQSSASEVKKQTNIAVFGEKQDSGEIWATKILITRYSGATGVGGE